VLGRGCEPSHAAEGLRARGAGPYEPGPKEGIALLAGAPAAAGLALARHRAARILARQLSLSAAAAIAAVQAPLDPYDAALEHLDDDPLLAGVLRELRARLAQAPSPHGSRQAPVSFRVVPQVLAHVEREVGRLEADVRHALRTTTDSPAFVGGRFVSNGGFHAVQLAADLDTVAAALIRAAELAGQRVHRLLDRRFTGLPDQLTPSPGPHAGLVAVHKRVSGAVHALGRLAAPASTGQADTALGQEDAGTFVFEAAAKLRQVEACVREVLACELLTARQAWALRGAAPPAFAVPLAELISPVDADRPLGPDLTVLVERLERDDLFDLGGDG
jgi:histidine ammonia-lyase